MHRFSSRFAALGMTFLLFPSGAFARTPDDSFFSEQWYLDAIQAPSAWDITTGSSEVIVAVLDTGVDADHEDLAQNLWVNSGEIAGNGKDDDRNGYIDDVHGWDFIDDDNDPSPVSSSSEPDAASHGTLIAGEIGAVGNNMVGIAGVSWNVSLMSVRMLGEDGSGTEADAANAIRYAVENGAKVINLSFAGDQAHSTLRNAVKDAYARNVVVVAAMGNEGRNTNNNPVYPACLRTEDSDWVIGVTAITESNRGADFTNYGTICADIAAPGTNIQGLAYSETGTSEYMGMWNGTSMASPLVAGAAALLFAEYPSLSAGDVRNILKLSVDPIRSTGYAAGALGAGRLNVARALTLAKTYSPEDADDLLEIPQTEEEDSEGETVVPPLVEDENILSYSYVAFGAPYGVLPEVDVYRADGTQYARFQAYTSNFHGGVHVAVINPDNDWIPEIVTGAGETGGPHVRIFTAYGALIDEFFAYDMSSSHGVNVAVGDVNGDTIEDIVTSVGNGVSQDIVMWTPSGEELSRFSASLFPESSPLSVTTVDYDDDIAEEIAVTGLIDGVAHVALYDADGTYLVDFVPYAGVKDISVARVDLDGDFYDDIAVTSLAATNDLRVFTKIGALRASKTLSEQLLIGNRVSGSDLDIDGLQDIVLLEHRDGGRVTLLSSDLQTILGTFTAPSFRSSTGPFMAAW